MSKEFVSCGEDQAGEWLRTQALLFPRESKRVLRHLVFEHMRPLIKDVVGHPTKYGIPPVSPMRAARQDVRIKRGGVVSRGKRAGYWQKFRASTRSYLGILGRLSTAVRYAPWLQTGYRTGFIAGSAESWAEKIQSGMRGAAGNTAVTGMAFSGGRALSREQLVTPAMRRLFFAMGYGLKKSTTILRTPERLAVDKAYAHIAPRLPDLYTARLQLLLDGKTPGGATGGQP